MRMLCAAIAAMCAVSVSLSAQWLTVPSEGLPRMADGRVNLTAPMPRTADGKPDFTGLWETERKYLLNLASDLTGADAPVLLPWAVALVAERKANNGRDRPDGFCLPSGVPKINAVPNPFEIVQTPRLVVILYEAFTTHRQVFLDGRRVPADANPTWMGYSVGRYEGDALVVETSGFNDRTWIDDGGLPHTEALHVTERFRRPDVGHLEIETTIDDAKTYARPWTAIVRSHLIPDQDLIEFVCNENERYTSRRLSR
jgi:hypothetical protein